jgi:hypothetical protein
MDEVDADTVNMSAEVREHVHRALLLPPVEVHSQVRHERLQVGEVRAIVSAGVLDLIGPARAGSTLLRVVEQRLLDVNNEWPDFHRVSLRNRL